MVVRRKMLPTVAITCHKIHAANCPPGQTGATNSPGEGPLPRAGADAGFMPMDYLGAGRRQASPALRVARNRTCRQRRRRRSLERGPALSTTIGASIVLRQLP